MGSRAELGQARHAGDGLGGGDRWNLIEGYHPLGHVGGIVADALQIAGDFQGGDDLAQIGCHGLAQGQQAHGALVQILL